MRAITLTAIAALQIAGSMGATHAAAATLTTLYAFQPPPDGNAPSGIVYYNGAFYGVATSGGTDLYFGTVFKVDATTGQEVILHSYNGNDGANPQGQMTVVGNKIYGTTYQSLSSGPWVFVIDGTTGAYSTVVDFDTSDASSLGGNLINVGGLLLGTAPVGGPNDWGTLYSVDPVAQTYKIILDFATKPDASDPGPGLIYNAGNLYGVSARGGSKNQGAIYKVNPSAGTETVLYSLSGQPAPQASPLVTHGDMLYGALWHWPSKHPKAYGMVFSFNMKTSKYKTLRVYQGGSDGAAGQYGLTYWNGSLYGATTGDGAAGCGSIFKMDPKTGTSTVLYTFLNKDDGCNPSGQLVYLNGSFYGVAQQGHNKEGTIFKLTP